SYSSHVSHVPHGVAPPAQFNAVLRQIENASTTVPSGANRIELTPPMAGISWLTARYQPPGTSGSTKVAAPSGKARYSNLVPGTLCPDVAMIRLSKPGSSTTPLASWPGSAGPDGTHAWVTIAPIATMPALPDHRSIVRRVTTS